MNSNTSITKRTSRIVTWLMASLLITILVALQAKAAFAVAPKNISIIDRDVITIGDIFEGIPAERALQVLGPAPKPGKDMVLNARTLMRLASALDLKWLPKTANEQVTIRRAGLEIGEPQLVKLITEKLEVKGVTGPVKLTLLTKPDLVLPAGTEMGVELISLNFNPEDNSFQGDVAAPSAANPIKRGLIAGTIERTLSLPVLKKSLTKGDVISAADLDWISVSDKTVEKNWVMDADNVIGLSPRKLVTSGKPLVLNDFESPVMVERGQTVTLVYKSDGISLNTTGKAAQPGRKGDIIRVTNISSNKIISGIVSGDQQVEVQ